MKFINLYDLFAERKNKKKNCLLKGNGFTLTEVLIAVAIVGIVSLLVIPSVVNRVQSSIFNNGYKKVTTSILDTINQLPKDERMNITDSEFMKKYMKISRTCNTHKSSCFAAKYTKIEGKNKTSGYIYSDLKGNCAVLKNGMSLCMEFSDTDAFGVRLIEGYIDLNGKKGPNVVGRDLRKFDFKITKSGNKEFHVGEVNVVKPTVVDACENKEITNPSDVCCDNPLYSNDAHCNGCNFPGTAFYDPEECCNGSTYDLETCCQGVTYDEDKCCKNGYWDDEVCCSAYPGEDACDECKKNWQPNANCCKDVYVGSNSERKQQCCASVELYCPATPPAPQECTIDTSNGNQDTQYDCCVEKKNKGTLTSKEKEYCCFGVNNSKKRFWHMFQNSENYCEAAIEPPTQECTIDASNPSLDCCSKKWQNGTLTQAEGSACCGNYSFAMKYQNKACFYEANEYSCTWNVTAKGQSSFDPTNHNDYSNGESIIDVSCQNSDSWSAFTIDYTFCYRMDGNSLSCKSETRARSGRSFPLQSLNFDMNPYTHRGGIVGPYPAIIYSCSNVMIHGQHVSDSCSGTYKGKLNGRWVFKK